MCFFQPASGAAATSTVPSTEPIALRGHQELLHSFFFLGPSGGAGAARLAPPLHVGVCLPPCEPGIAYVGFPHASTTNGGRRAAAATSGGRAEESRRLQWGKGGPENNGGEGSRREMVGTRRYQRAREKARQGETSRQERTGRGRAAVSIKRWRKEVTRNRSEMIRLKGQQWGYMRDEK